MTSISTITRPILLLWCCWYWTRTNALKHSVVLNHDHRSLIGPVGVPFGFLEGGHYEMMIRNFHLHGSSSIDAVEAVGLLLKKFKNEADFNEYMQIIQNDQSCAFEYFIEDNDDTVFNMDDDSYSENGPIENFPGQGIFYSLKPRARWDTDIPIEYVFKAGEEGLYFLIYQICPLDADIQTSIQLDFHFCNIDAFGTRTFLSAGEIHLPRVFLFFAISYLTCFLVWYTNIQDIRKGGKGHFEKDAAARPIIYPIHQLMTLLLLVKFISVIFESCRYYYIGWKGHAELLTLLYYFATAIKTSFLFVVILLLGTGWSIVKNFVSKSERNMIFCILVLQAINNIALTVISNENEGDAGYDRWLALLHLVDIICCCAVLIPLVWQVNALEKNAGIDDWDDEEEHEMGLQDGEKNATLEKLKLFRSFYLLVVGYIYATRILVYLFASALDYRHLWLRHFVVELVTLAFYVVVGIMFRPMSENPYLSTARDEEEEGLIETSVVEMQSNDKVS